MLLNVTEYYRPETLAEALQLLKRPGVKSAPLAGGTLLVGKRDKDLQAVVDLRALDLNAISEHESEIHIGALVTLQGLVESPIIRELAGGILEQAARTSAARLIRNAATIGGTLASGPAAQADLAVALAALNARARLIGEHERVVLAEGVFQERRPEELLVDVLIERPSANSAGAFLRVARAPDDVALVHAAAVLTLQGGICQQARVAVGGVGMAPMRLQGTEQMLAGKHPDQAQIASAVTAGLDAFAPPPDFRASPAYRRDVAATLARRALAQCADAARWRQIMGDGKEQR